MVKWMVHKFSPPHIGLRSDIQLSIPRAQGKNGISLLGLTIQLPHFQVLTLSKLFSACPYITMTTFCFPNAATTAQTRSSNVSWPARQPPDDLISGLTSSRTLWATHLGWPWCLAPREWGASGPYNASSSTVDRLCLLEASMPKCCLASSWSPSWSSGCFGYLAGIGKDFCQLSWVSHVCCGVIVLSSPI